MGHRTTQRILECGVCGNTPDNGEYLWEMGSEHWCESCCNKDEDDGNDVMSDMEWSQG